MSEIQDRTFSARLDCHYLLHTPDVVDAHTLLVVTLHGFGTNPGSMLQPTARLFDSPPVIAPLQGPEGEAHDLSERRACWLVGITRGRTDIRATVIRRTN